MVKAEEVLELLQMREFANLTRPDVPIPGCIQIWSPGPRKIEHGSRIKYNLGPNSEEPEIIISLANPEASFSEAQLKRKIRLSSF